MPADATITGVLGSTPEQPPALSGFSATVALSVETSVQPTGPVTVEIPVAPDSFRDADPVNDDAVLVWHKHEQEDWEALTGRLDRTRNVVRVETSRLSSLVPSFPSLDELKKKAGEIANGIFGGPSFKTESPTCLGDIYGKQSDYKVRSTTSDVVRWCVGEDKGKVQLRVVLNRRYALLASMTDSLSVESNTQGEFGAPAATQQISKMLDRNQITLIPGGTAVLSVKLDPGQSARLHGEFDGLAQALVQLQLGLELTKDFMVKLPGAFGTAVTIANDVPPECVKQLLNVGAEPDDTQRVGAMLEACIDPETMLKGVSKLGVQFIQKFVVPVFKTGAFIQGALNALADVARGKDKYDIVITRSGASAETPGGGTQPVTGSAYPAGSWSGRARRLELSADGTGTAMYLLHGPAGGCTARSESRQPCYFNVQFKLSGGSDPMFTGAVTKTWYTDGSEVVPTSEYGRNLPAVGAAVSVSFDHTKDMAYYKDSHGTTDVCGPNPKVARQSCS
jgi:hypothetical protein